MVAQVEYSVAGRSRDRVTLCAVLTELEARDVGSILGYKPSSLKKF
jgi:hypothetical protein